MYASSRMITRLYQPLLEKLDLTYPQYLVMLVMWQEEKMTITELGNKLFLKTNTLTPLLKKMRDKDLIRKRRSKEDERTVFVQLTEKANALREQAKNIPAALIESLHMTEEEIETIRKIMWKFLQKFNETQTEE